MITGSQACMKYIVGVSLLKEKKENIIRIDRGSTKIKEGNL